MPISLIITVLNEAKTIQLLLQALVRQTLAANEIIIVDGGSDDQTVNLITEFKQNYLKKKKNKHNGQVHSSALKKLNLKIFTKKGNRSVGRNFAIKQAKNSLIAITDAGCIPQTNWLEELVKKYQHSKAAVVAGFYRGQAQNNFATAVIPYVLVMPDQVDPNHFLPATRSMLMEKSVWQKMNGFDEDLNFNEDYAFAKKLVKNQVSIAFTATAIVDWLAISNLEDYLKMIFRFAKGDIQAKILRPKVVLIFSRYLLALILLMIAIVKQNMLLWLYLIMLVCLYVFWSIFKNYRYCPKAWFWLPILQISTDLTVMYASLSACF